MKVIIWQNENGNVSVCYPTGEVPLEKVKSESTPAESIVVDWESLPNQDNDFYDAWELNGNAVVVSMTKAKDLTKQRLRRDREPLLAAQDVAFQRALESGADTTDIVAEKQRLRDITKLADTCNTTDELRKLSV